MQIKSSPEVIQKYKNKIIFIFFSPSLHFHLWISSQRIPFYNIINIVLLLLLFLLLFLINTPMYYDVLISELQNCIFKWERLMFLLKRRKSNYIFIFL